MKNYKVYFLLNKKREVIYCGSTRRQLSRRYAEHMYERKLNREEHSISLVKENLSFEEASILESMLIKQHNLCNVGLNISEKSQGGYIRDDRPKVNNSKGTGKFGKPVSNEHAEKNRTARLGHRSSEEHIRKIAEKTSKPVICIETGIVYKSARQAATELDLNYTKISSVCNGKRNSTGSLHFKFYKTVEANRND